MQAIGKYLVIHEVKESVSTASGLELSGKDAKELRYRKGTVVSSGDEVTSVKDNDVIYYDSSRSFTIMIEGNQRTIIRSEDVLLVA